MYIDKYNRYSNDIYYVYKYVHPDKGVIYVGKTVNIGTRHYIHLKSYSDNIKEKDRPLLIESDLYYKKMFDESIADLYETICIRYYKPMLNIMKQSKNINIDVEHIDENWIKYDDEYGNRSRSDNIIFTNHVHNKDETEKNILVSKNDLLFALYLFARNEPSINMAKIDFHNIIKIINMLPEYGSLSKIELDNNFNKIVQFLKDSKKWYRKRLEISTSKIRI